MAQRTTLPEPCADPMAVTFHASTGPCQQGDGGDGTHTTLTLSTPGAGVRLLGASGTWFATAHGVTALDGDDRVLDPPGPTANTVNMYATPGSRPCTVALVQGEAQVVLADAAAAVALAELAASALALCPSDTVSVSTT